MVDGWFGDPDWSDSGNPLDNNIWDDPGPDEASTRRLPTVTTTGTPIESNADAVQLWLLLNGQTLALTPPDVSIPVMIPDIPISPDLVNCLSDILDYLDGANFPENVDMRQMRDVAENIATDLVSLSNSQLPELGNPFVEYGAFLIRNPDGSVTTSAPFTELSSDQINLTSGQALTQLLAVGSDSVIVGIIHTHSVSPLPSAGDFSAVSTLINALSTAGISISVDPDATLYIIGPDGEIREYARGSNGGDTNRLGVTIDENGDFEFTCETV